MKRLNINFECLENISLRILNYIRKTEDNYYMKLKLR